MDKDNTDFREWNTIYNNKRENNCPFCNLDISSSKITINKYDTAVAFEDKYPVVLNHILVTPLRHVSSFFELSLFEKRCCFLLIDEIRKMLQIQDKTITGFNVGFNDGIDAGQTIFHCHIHVIPRRKNHIPDPIGGIRNIIPNRRKY